MIYLKNFQLPSWEQEEYNNLTPRAYPYGIFPFKKIEEFSFEPITIFYGSNGSGKSTLLNLISEKLNLPRTTPFNSSQLFNQYVETKCDYIMGCDEEGFPLEIPLKSKTITSEDVFNHILAVRNENLRINKEKNLEKQRYYEAKNDGFQFKSMSDYDQLKIKNAARKQTVSRFIRDRTNPNIEQFSNGETALSYFDSNFESDSLYLLDEPENSLSPQFQLQLMKLIRDCAYYCNCQFIIATHSPFILSIDDAQIYDLDSIPARVRKWYELENVKAYYEFFEKYNELFK
ncbi:MAG: AAA family ATPase [Marinisporobacter sp.]|jgi:predicted ATPase|nr:AAA family ATPase [Marinisporobacter sp.]